MSEILREKLDSKLYIGYSPETIYEIRGGEPLGWENMRPLRKIPRKISYFMHNFTEVRRFPFKDEKTKNQYFIKSTTGKFYEVLY